MTIKMETFSYSTDYIQNLLQTDSFFGNSNNTKHVSTDCNLLLELSMKKMRLETHMGALGEYCKAQMIPRGLRITKPPGMFQDNQEFTHRWEAILNKCSLDLMVLLIETSQQECKVLTDKFEQHKEELSKIMNSSTLNSKLEQFDAQVSQKLKELKDLKFKKFQRDLGDYQEGKVYSWKPRRGQFPPHNKKRVSFDTSIETSREESSLGGTTTDSSTDYSMENFNTNRRPFLEKQSNKWRSKDREVERRKMYKGRYLHKHR